MLDVGRHEPQAPDTDKDAVALVIAMIVARAHSLPPRSPARHALAKSLLPLRALLED